MEDPFLKYATVLMYGIVSVMLVGTVVYLNCLGSCSACPMHLVMPLAFMSFIMTALPPLIEKIDLKQSIKYGLVSTFTLFFAISLFHFLDGVGCSAFAIIDIGMYAVFFTASGSFLINWEVKEPELRKKIRKIKKKR